jgi:hypothetical protein
MVYLFSLAYSQSPVQFMNFSDTGDAVDIAVIEGGSALVIVYDHQTTTGPISSVVIDTSTYEIISVKNLTEDSSLRSKFPKTVAIAGGYAVTFTDDVGVQLTLWFTNGTAQNSAYIYLHTGTNLGYPQIGQFVGGRFAIVVGSLPGQAGANILTTSGSSLGTSISLL